jgi:fermentation-respiration switch protein FrsA (DUF1100 family)
MSEAAAHPASKGVRASVWARVATETGLATLAFAVIAVHVADDNFLQPQRGTSALDHGVSGFVPLAVVAAVAAGYGRFRPGARAALAILLGVFGVVGGVEAVYYARNGGVSGDDYTGLVSIPAGLLLLSVGALTLWRSRRTDDTLRRRYLRRALLTAAAAVVATQALFPASIAYVATHTARAEVPRADLGAPHEDVSFKTSDGLRLEGWFVPSRNGATIIVFPGRKGPQPHARMLVDQGYGVLLFDRRGEGSSEGDPNGFGYAGERDLHAAVAFLERHPGVDPRRIGGLGLSVGGEMLIHAAAESNMFKAVISEGASGQSVRDTLANRGFVGALGELMPMLNVTAATAIFSNSLPPQSLKSDAERIAPRALFLVYGEKGQGGSEKQPNLGFYSVAGEPKEIWEVPDGQHIAGLETRPQEYERRVVGFFDRTLLPSRRNERSTP